MDVTRHKGKQLSIYVTEAILGKQLNHQTALCLEEMPIIFFKYFVLIIIVESKHFKNCFVIVCSEAELRLTVITVRNDLLRNVLPIRDYYKNIDVGINLKNINENNVKCVVRCV